MDAFLIAFDDLKTAFDIVFVYWWLWVPVFLFVTLYIELLRHNRLVHLSTLEWAMLEIRVPQEPHKSLKAMEQIFVALHAIALPSPPKNLIQRYRRWKAVFVEGKVQDWNVLEIVSTGGEIHYYIRTLEKYRNLVEAQVYAHYPESEITQVPDWLAQLPAVLPAPDFDVTGLELALIKEEIFPLKTYPEFEEEHAGKEDVRTIDPLAPLAEAMSALGLGENLAVQVLIRSTGGDWINKSQAAIDKLWGRAEKKESPAGAKVLDAIESGIGAALGAAPTEPKKEEKKEDKKWTELSPGTQEVIKAIERNNAKLAFETGIRVFYAAPTDRFDGSGRIRNVAAAFKQFSTQALNGFKSGWSVEVLAGFRKEAKTRRNKPIFWRRFKFREFPRKPFVLSTEELTTIYHFPDPGVKTPALPRIEAKKGEAPAGIPIV